MHSPTFIRRNPFSFILMAFLLFFLSFGSGMLCGTYAYLGMYTNPYFEMPDNVAYSYTSIEAAEGAVAAAKPGCAGYACENITAVEGVMSRAFLCTKEVATYGTLGKKGLLENGLNFLYFIPAKGTQFTPGKFYYAGKGTETLSTLAQIDYQGLLILQAAKSNSFIPDPSRIMLIMTIPSFSLLAMKSICIRRPVRFLFFVTSTNWNTPNYCPKTFGPIQDLYGNKLAKVAMNWAFPRTTKGLE